MNEPKDSAGKSDVKTAGKEIWDVFARHNLTHEQALNIMAATVSMMGRKTGDEVGVFFAFLSKALKICPALADVPGKPGEETVGRFQKPTLEMVKLNASKTGLPELEASRFFDYYESNGWRVGKNTMKSWTSAMANWKRNFDERRYQNTGKSNPSNHGDFGMPSTPAQTGARIVAELKARGDIK